MGISYKKIIEEDVREYYELVNQLDHDTNFMLYEPNERIYNEELYTNIIKNINQNGLLLGAFDNKIIGFIAVQRNTLLRTTHRASIVIGVLNSYHNMKIGQTLLQKAIQWAENEGVKRIELTVMSNNQKAIKLYEDNGFKCEGKRKKAIYLNNEYLDELYMAKLF